MKFENNGQEIILDEFPTTTGQYRVIDYNSLPAREWVFDSFESAKNRFIIQIFYAMNVYMEGFCHE